jgi:hypothetical protein
MNKTTHSDCYGIAYEVNDEMCIKCALSNNCKKENISQNKHRLDFMDVID